MISWLSNSPHRGMAFRAMILGLVVLVAAAATGPIAFHLGGLAALMAASVAAVLCLAGAGAALVVSHRLQGPHQALVALSVATTLRMGVPLACGLVIHLLGGPLAEAGLLYYLLVFYPITLAVGTALSLPTSRRPMSSREASLNARS
jgi:hypothetical protein